MSAPSTPSPAAAVDAQNPWLGLASFTEEVRGFFHGRDEEVAELARRVQRKLLTIFFGQSGLGKTSLLRAGLAPRLRTGGYCPVYVRVDYSPDAPPPAEQIKQAIARVVAGEHGGRFPTPATGESLWEFLHHREDALRDAAGQALVPLLIFDQFEEVFTLAQSDDAGRRRAQAFLTELADLVENRPPRDFEARMERDEALAERFDFARADYRVLLALREDYLAQLEGLKLIMPSVTQNRLRLARMTGTQALEAVVRPGRHLVTEAVARQIVLFVSGAADLATAEVEPSLLSLVCRELNDTRHLKGEAEISADLLAGSRATILAQFYERALADQPAGVRHFLEDTLLTDSGFRESIAEERMRQGLAALGAPAGTLDTLVGRRLLRIEERLDVRRVELTHDVLCGVVKASRDVRREREAKEAAEKQLVAAQQQEAAVRRGLQRSRRIAAAGCTLAVVAVAGALFGYVNMRRAEALELKARRQAYAADINAVQNWLAKENLGRARMLLNRQRPAAGQFDLRGWEWRYLWPFVRGDAVTSDRSNTDPVSSLAASADNRWLAIGTAFGSVIWHDLRSGWKQHRQVLGHGSVRVAFSPRQPLAALTRSWHDVPLKIPRHGVFLWDTSTRRLLRRLPVRYKCVLLVFSPDGRELLTYLDGGKNEVIVWRVEDGAELRRFSAPGSPQTRWAHAAVSPDFKWLVHAAPQGRLRMIDIATGAESWSVPASESYVLATAFSPDGKWVLSGGGYTEGVIKIRDAQTGVEVGQLEGHRRFVSALVFLPDGKTLASASADQTVRLWDLPTRRLVRTLHGHTNEVSSLALLADGKTLVSGSKEGEICSWNLAEPPRGEQTAAIPQVLTWRFADDASVFLVTATGNVVRRSGPGFAEEKVLMKLEGSSRWLQFAPDAPLLARGGKKVEVWEVETGQLRVEVKPPGKGLFTPALLQGKRARVYLYSLYSTMTMELSEWDLEGARQLRSWPLDARRGRWSFSLSPDGRWLFGTASGGAGIRIDLQDGSALTFETGDASTAGQHAITSDSRFVAIPSASGVVRIFDIATLKPTSILPQIGPAYHSAAFSADDQRLATGSSGPEVMAIWDAQGYELLMVLAGHAPVLGLTAFSPQGNVLGSLSSVDTLYLWRAPSFEEIAATEAADQTRSLRSSRAVEAMSRP